MSASLSWRLNRLKAMGPAEIGWRARRALVGELERWGFGLAGDAAAEARSPGAAWVSPLPADFDAEPYVRAADRILAGQWSLFSEDFDLGFPPRWNRDPKTGVEARLEFGKSIDYRNEHVVGDVKYLWELNRHLEIVTLAQAWHLTRAPRFAEGVRCLLSSWLEQCPYPRGPQWTSSLELAVRLINWACAWHLLGSEASPLFTAGQGQELRRRWLEAIYRHCHFVSGNLSRHSSANNHLLGELTGLFVAAVTWPLWPESARWRAGARDELEAEALKQNGGDGVNREQAFWYQHEVADMMLLGLLFGRANGVLFSTPFSRRLESMLEFIAAVMDAGGHVPMVGDADDGVIVRFSREPEFCPFRSLLATGAVLFGRGDLRNRAGRFDDKSRWLLGDSASTRFRELPVSRGEGGRLAFPEGGYFVLGQDFGTPREVKVVVDSGPLGYLSIAAHGHADALAFTLSLGGSEVLVDPGTYAYHTQKRWRDYFRGTSAHNTVRVDGEEQSVSGGSFMWLRHADARIERFESGPDLDEFEGVHDGYLRLDDPVRHRRRIEFDKRGMRIEVLDTLECAAEHSVDLHWHLSESCVTQVSGHTVDIECGSVRLRVVCPRELDAPEVVIGREDLPLGWISRRLDKKQPSPVIVCSGRVTGDTSLRTVFSVTDACAIKAQAP